MIDRENQQPEQKSKLLAKNNLHLSINTRAVFLNITHERFQQRAG